MHLERGRRGVYAIVSDDDGRTIPERDFARMYKERTGSSSLDGLDHPHDTMTIIGASIGGVLLAVSATASVVAVDACHNGDSGRCSDAATVGVVLGAFGLVVLVPTLIHAANGSPEDHDLSATEMAPYVRSFNAAPSRPAPRASTVVPLLGSGGVGFRF